MNHLNHLLILAALTIAMTASASAEEPDFSFQMPDAQQMQEAYQEWQKLGQPSHMHRRLEYFLGDWSTVTKIYGMGPEPMSSTGEASFSWLFDGRWLQQRYAGSMMGQPFTGMGITGYDNFRNQFVNIWLDDMSTVLTVTSGLLDRTGETLVTYGPMDEPMLDQINKMAKYVTRIIDEKTHVFEIHDPSIGEENSLVVEITYTRK